MKVHELVSDELWAAIEPLLPPHPAQPRGGRSWLRRVRGPLRHHLRAADGHPVAVAAAGAGLRQRGDVLAAAARLGAGRGLAAPASCPARAAGRGGHAGLVARTGINRSTVRAALRELRGKLGIAQDADLVAAARATGLLATGESDRA